MGINILNGPFCARVAAVYLSIFASRVFRSMRSSHRHQSDGFRFYRLRPNWASLESSSFAPVALIDEPRSASARNIAVMFRIAL
jgi:hypothetical protein